MRTGRDRDPRPRSTIEKCFRVLLGEDDARVFLSELREAYEARLENEGPTEARRAFRREVGKGLALALLARVRREPPSPHSGRSIVPGGRSTGIVMDNLLRDVSFAARSLRRRPMFSSIAILTLGLGIGSATTVFSVVEGVLLRPLPFHRPQDLVTITQTIPSWRDNDALSRGWDRVPFSQPAFRRLQENQSSFTDVAIYRLGSRTLVEEGELTSVPVGLGSASLFSVLGVQPILGRAFLPEEDGPAATAVALVSEEIWRERYGAEPGVLGQSVNLSGRSYSIIGVLPAGLELRSFSLPEPRYARGFWVPLGRDSGQFGEDMNGYQAIARLRPQGSMGLAQEEASALVQGGASSLHYGARVRSLREEWTGTYRRPLTLLLGAALVVLLIACGNVAALLIGEAPGRRREVATRRALGAGGRRIGQQLLTENLILGIAGSACGILLSHWGTVLLLSLAPPIPRLEAVGMNGWVLLFAVVAGVVTSLGFGMAPVIELIGPRAIDAGGRGGRVLGAPSGLLHRAVIAGEIALTVLLLVGGGLLTRSLFNLMDVDPGFQQEGLIEAQVNFPSFLFPDQALRRVLNLEMIEAIHAVPGVAGVSGTTRVPFSGPMNTTGIQILDRGPAENHELPTAERRRVLPGYFQTMGIALLRGRDFSDADGPDAPRVAVISNSMARQFWPGRDALGARFLAHDTVTVVGVVGDVLHESLRADPHPTFYLANAQQEREVSLSLVIRTERDHEAVLPEIREAIKRIDPRTSIARLASASALVGESARDERFRATLFAAFALAAVLLSAAGVFGVTARGVEARKGELGVRMALGAQKGGLIRLTLLPGLVSGLVGLSVGLSASLGTSRLLEGFLFGVEPRDPTTYGLVASMILGISLIATYLPSRRIERLDPATVLREE